MGAIKDAIDLMLTLEARIKDRKTLDLLFPLKQKIYEAQIENLDIKNAHFDEKREIISKHDTEIENIKANYIEEMARIKASFKDAAIKLSYEYNAEISRLTKQLEMCESKSNECNSELEKIKSKHPNSIQIIRG